MKKVLSVILSVCVLISAATASVSALAGEAKSAKVQLSACFGGDYILNPVDVEVSADLDKIYDVGYKDSSDEPTLLDALIAQNIEVFGVDDFAASPSVYFSVDSSGWLITCFGNEANYCSYYHNGASASGVNEVLANGDYIEFALTYTDSYAYFNTRSANVNVGEEFSLTLLSDGYDDRWNYVTGLKVADAQVLVNGSPAAVTDGEGIARITLNKPGKYIITAKAENYMIPYCEIVADYSVEDRMLGACGYLIGKSANIDVSASADYLTYLNSGYDMSKYNDKFLGSVLKMLKGNDGKLVNDGSEDLGLYGAVITIVRELGLDPKDFYGYDLVSRFEALNAGQIGNPYYYRVAIEAANSDFAHKLCDKFIADYYVMGKGMDYWGFSCDNTAIFLTSIAKYADDYSEIVEDAKAVIESYTTENGCFYNMEYTDISPDSTAVALMAYSALGDVDKTEKLYNNLCNGFESTDKPGVMLYLGAENEYATREALLAFEYMHGIIEPASFVHTNHYMIQSSSVQATCTATGVKTYLCAFCDEEKTEIIPKATHTYKTYVTKASTKKNGSAVTKCTVCGAKKSSKTIYYPKAISLSTTSYTYNGKVKKPSVTVKDSKGKKISSKYYTVTYSKGRKYVGKYAVKIKFKGNYTGTVKKTFTIKPKSTSISRLTSGKKKFTAKWKKQSTQTTGYQIQYSTSSKFKSAKTVTVGSNKTTSKTISKLKAKKKYYVRIRTYKTVNGNKIYSSWSKAKSVTTKK